MNQQDINSKDNVIWYKQFWPWFLIALPGVVVIASFITIYIAVTHPDPVIDGNYYKHGLTINEQLNSAEQAPAAKPASQEGEHR